MHFKTACEQKTMEKEHREIIEEDYLFLNRCMVKNTRIFIKFLTEELKIMNPEKGEDILDEISNFKRAQKMLDFFYEENTEEAFDALYKGCLHVHLWKAADILVPENSPHQPEKEEDVVEHLPEKWPSSSHFEMIEDPTRMSIKPCGPKMRTLYQQCIMEDSELYNMCRKDKGRVLIISNEEFHNMPTRKGSHYDLASLTYLFSHLGFEVHQHENLTTDEMVRVLNTEAEQIGQLSRCSCFILAIMSYGYDWDNGVFGTDGVYDKDPAKCKNYLEMGKDIKNRFTSLSLLAKKPKVFLIVAQQPAGRDRDGPQRSQKQSKIKYTHNFESKNLSIVSHHSTVSDGETLSKITLPDLDMYRNIICPKVIPQRYELKKLGLTVADGPSGEADESLTQGDGPSAAAPGSIQGTAAEDAVASDSDIFLAVATPRELMRNDERKYLGSWFIQAFVFVVVTYGHQLDLREIFEKVNGLSASQGLRIASSQEVAYCLPNLTSNKKFYFFPGILAED